MPSSIQNESQDLKISCRQFSKLLSSHFRHWVTLLSRRSKEQRNLNSFPVLSGEFQRGRETTVHRKTEAGRRGQKWLGLVSGLWADVLRHRRHTVSPGNASPCPCENLLSAVLTESGGSRTYICRYAIETNVLPSWDRLLPRLQAPGPHGHLYPLCSVGPSSNTRDG